MTWRHRIKQLARKFDIELNYLNPAQSAEARYLKQLDHHRIRTIIDVGANDGGYAAWLREIGYQGDIFSFEPMTKAHGQLVLRAHADLAWHVMPRVALGAAPGTAVLHIAGNSRSSSLLPMAELHRTAAPLSDYVGEEPVPVAPLADYAGQLFASTKATLLKIDTQGYESHVLAGAEPVLDRIDGIQLEISLAPLYEGQTSHDELMAWMAARGFSIWNLQPGFVDPRSGRMLQFDALFFRSHGD